MMQSENSGTKVATIKEMPPPTASTSADMVMTAIERGATPEMIGKILDWSERIEANTARKAFDAAMSAAKAKMPTIVKNRTVDFTSQKGRTNYRYEDFASIAEAVTPVLSERGLDFRFRTNSDKESMTVTCIISHRDGHSEENSLTAPNDMSGNKNAIQAIGSTQTYLQRYTLKAALGLAASIDDDAQAAATATPETVMPDQVEALEKMIEEIGGDRANLLKKNTLNYFKVACLEDLPTSKFNTVVAALELKRGK